MVDFVYYEIDLLHLKVYYIIHESLALGHVPGKEVEVKACFRGERLHHIAIEVNRYEAA